MVERLAAEFAQRDPAAAVGGGVAEHVAKERRREVEAAARGEQHAAGREQAHRAQVDLLVAAERGVERVARLRERRRVEHDRVVARAALLLGAREIRTRRLSIVSTLVKPLRAAFSRARASAGAEESSAVTCVGVRARCSANEP